MLLETADIPAPKVSSAGRPKAPNPFTDTPAMWERIKAMPIDSKDAKGAALRVEVPGILDIKTNKEFGKTSRQIRDAGYAREPKVTMKQTHEQVIGADGKPSVRITFWAVTMIERKKKGSETTPETTPAEGTEEAIDAQAKEAEKVADANDAEAAETPVKPAAKPSGRTRAAAK